MLHNCIFSSRPLSITLVVRHTRTQPLSLLPLYSSALAFPTTSFLSRPQKCYYTIYWHVRVFCVFFSLQNHFILRLDSYYFHEIPTTKFSLSSSEMSLWQTEQTDTKPFLFSFSSWSRSFQDPSGGDSSQVSHCRALRTWVTHVSWHNGRLSHRQRREVSKLRAILFLIAACSPLFFFPLTLMTLLFDLVNYANSYFLYLGTGVKWGCDQPCACPHRSSHLLLTSPGALCSFAKQPSPVLCPTVASQIPAPSRLSVLSFYIVDTLTNHPGIIFHSLQAGFLIYSPHPDGWIRN